MGRRKHWLLVGSALALLAPAGARAQGQQYHNPTQHFSVTIPEGWAPVPPELITRANAQLGQQNTTVRGQYLVGFLPKDQPPDAGLLLLIGSQSMPTRAFSLEQIEKQVRDELDKDLQQAEATNLRFSVESLSLDRAKNRLTLLMTLEPPGVGKLRVQGIGMIGSRGIVFLNCYAPDAEFDNWAPTFNAVADSFKYDDGFTYVPLAEVAAATQSQTGTPSLTRMLLIGTAGGVAGGALAGFVYFLARATTRAA